MENLKGALRTGLGQQKVVRKGFLQVVRKGRTREVSPDKVIWTRWQYFFLAV